MDPVSSVSKQYAFLFEEVPSIHQQKQQSSKSTMKEVVPLIGHDVLPSSLMTGMMDIVDDYYLYLFPAFLLNPCFIIHVLNTILTIMRPDLDIPYLTWMHAQPHLDINNNNTVALLFTTAMLIIETCAYQYCIDVLSQRKRQKEAAGEPAKSSWQLADDG